MWWKYYIVSFDSSHFFFFQSFGQNTFSSWVIQDAKNSFSSFFFINRCKLSLFLYKIMHKKNKENLIFFQLIMKQRTNEAPLIFAGGEGQDWGDEARAGEASRGLRGGTPGQGGGAVPSAGARLAPRGRGRASQGRAGRLHLGQGATGSRAGTGA